MAMDGTPIIIKKKKSHAHAHHGGSWKVAYADFVTAMMAFFMVLWIMGLSDQTRTQVSGYFSDPLGYSKTPPRTKSLFQPLGLLSPKPGVSRKGGTEDVDNNKVQAEVDKMLEKLGPNSFKDHTDVSADQEGVRIEFVEDKGTVFFESGSSELTQGARKYLAELAPSLTKIGRKMIFEGHTDAKPYSRAGYDNWDLSADRATALKREMQRDHVPTKQFAGIRALADTHLKVPSKPFSAQNRRVAILLPFQAEKEVAVDIKGNDIKEDMTGHVSILPAPPNISGK
jgi:chemotaxis protein MotB